MTDEKEHTYELVPSLNQELRKFSTLNLFIMEAIAGKLRLNATDLKCRDLLNYTGPITAGKLAKLTNLTTGAITGVIDRLEKEELVERVHDPEDRRRVIIQPLTHRAPEIRNLFKPLNESLSELFKKYNDEELHLLLDMLVELNALYPKELMKVSKKD
ncbi:MarR family transcriptional regulator [Bacillus sp. FJAT-49736]|uniref:MarR family transcriptional regulator n=1 Tax=Bacillus sp. FJAT-49736 TaxID=2833582 RepID=UPI001BC9F4E5|nr:MarR family transcriptional regulator [Bacillus sp. FJAT-49736]MBS4174407.1 MarR family transcriptional regulator [Bacillus sp. FJAT-49736]